jgi:tetraacyldisaccharide 4'-kinase
VTLPAIARILLRPLGFLYGGLMRLRVSLYRSGLLRTRRLQGVVISVGNLTLGGTGKTPMVLWIAERLAAEGHRPAILTRGYRGFGKSGVPGKTGANDKNNPDEVALLRHRLDGRARFGIGKDRYRNGLALAKDGAEWFILDDGFQHLALERDADILLLDATDPFGGGGILPSGRLREPRSALARADVVVITRASHAPAVETMVRRFTNAPVFTAQMRLEAVLRAPSMREALSESERRRCKFFALCGIGNPRAFFDDLRSWGFSVAGARSFADHHRYSAAEIRGLESAAAAVAANALICTEKDVFNLPPAFAGAFPIYACRISMSLNDENAFWTAVRAAVGRSQPVTQV